jgi:hypothetical protein
MAKVGMTTDACGDHGRSVTRGLRLAMVVAYFLRGARLCL